MTLGVREMSLDASVHFFFVTESTHSALPDLLRLESNAVL